MALPPLQIAINPGPGVAADELERLSRGLRDELLDLDVIAVDHAATAPAPAGTKGLAGADIGTLVVTLSNSAVLVTLAGVLKSWADRAKGRKITMRFGADEDSIEVGGASPQDLAELLRSWMVKHGQR
jgi:hypothetical protein